MEFQILGPLEVRLEGRQLALGAAKQRTLLAILLVRANQVVSIDRLIEELWPQPPETAANAIQVYVGKLRKTLEPDRARGDPGSVLVTRAPGYLLRRAGPARLRSLRAPRGRGQERRRSEGLRDGSEEP